MGGRRDALSSGEDQRLVTAMDKDYQVIVIGGGLWDSVPDYIAPAPSLLLCSLKRE